MFWSLFMKTILRIPLFLLIFSVNLFAAQTIDVKSMTISQSSTGPTSIRLVANNSSNQEIVLVQGDSSALIPYSAFSCSPCFIPKVLSTNGFGSLGFRANLGQQHGQIIVTFSTPPVSDEITLHPRISRRKRNITVSGKTMLSISKIEVTDPFGIGTETLIDNDVTLDGGYVANFWLLFSEISPRRMTGFQNITFTFDEPRN
jgi:hypothetical protein